LYNLPIGSNRFEYLFKVAEKRKEYKDNILKIKVDSNCTFKPDIDLSQRRVRSKSHTKIDKNSFILPEIKLNVEMEEGKKNVVDVKKSENKVIDKQRKELYKKIFQLLDDDKDNIILPKKINTSSNNH